MQIDVSPDSSEPYHFSETVGPEDHKQLFGCLFLWRNSLFLWHHTVSWRDRIICYKEHVWLPKSVLPLTKTSAQADQLYLICTSIQSMHMGEFMRKNQSCSVSYLHSEHSTNCLLQCLSKISTTVWQDNKDWCSKFETYYTENKRSSISVNCHSQTAQVFLPLRKRDLILPLPNSYIY